MPAFFNGVVDGSGEYKRDAVNWQIVKDYFAWEAAAWTDPPGPRRFKEKARKTTASFQPPWSLRKSFKHLTLNKLTLKTNSSIKSHGHQVGTDQGVLCKGPALESLPKGRVWFERELLPTLPPELFKELWDINDAESWQKPFSGSPRSEPPCGFLRLMGFFSAVHDSIATLVRSWCAQGAMRTAGHGQTAWNCHHNHQHAPGRLLLSSQAQARTNWVRMFQTVAESIDYRRSRMRP
jgi:hypothetical protein